MYIERYIMNRILLASTIIITIGININMSKSEEPNTEQSRQNVSSNIVSDKQKPNNNFNNEINESNNPNVLDNIKTQIMHDNQVLESLNEPQSLMNNTMNTPTIPEYNPSIVDVNNIKKHTTPNQRTTDSLVKIADDLTVKLLPENAYGMFNNPKDMSKYNNDSLRVDFKLTKEICEAILNKKPELLKNIVLNPDKKYLGVYEDVLGKHIEHMVKKFNNIDDLKCMINYLTITGGKNTYTPILSMRSWLNSLECINEIYDIAKPFLDTVEDNKIIQSYELRVSLYFRAGNNSEICVPKAEQLSLLTKLNEIEKKINQILDLQKSQLEGYQDIMEIVKLQNEIQKLKQDKNIIALENINKDIKNKEEGKNKTIVEMDDKISKVPKITVSKRKGRSNLVENTAEINKIKNTYKEQIELLDKELAQLNTEKNKLEEECTQISEQIKKKEEQEQQLTNTIDNNKIGFVNTIISNNNEQIKNELRKAKELLNNDNSVKNNEVL